MFKLLFPGKILVLLAICLSLLLLVTPLALAAPPDIITAPTITSVYPPSGPGAGGTSVNITGTNFTGATSVNFGGRPSPDFAVTSPDSITVISPPGNGSVDVTVTTPAGTSIVSPDDLFTYLDSTVPPSAAPSITGLEPIYSASTGVIPVVSGVFPASGLLSGGTSVIIVGTDFVSVTSVKFGGTAATTYTVDSATRITATSPAGTGTVDITVVAGASATSSGDRFTYLAAGLPSVTGISPVSGPTTGGTNISITGTNFTGANSVRFDSTASPGFVVNSPTSITAASPAGTGNVHVTVITPGGESTASSADYFTYVSSTAGMPFAWGYNMFGQVGNNTLVDKHIPTSINGLVGITSIAAGGYHSLATASDGGVWAWGYNVKGALGDGTVTDRYSPVRVNNVTGAVQVEGGYYFSLVLKTNGTVWGWGCNYYGQLGDGGYGTYQLSPVQANGLTGVTGIAAGAYHSMAIKPDGTLWTWGQDNSGQLGDGANLNRYLPAQVSSLSGIIKIAAGFQYSLALKSDGTVWAWGDNSYGQLGDGTTTNRNVPVQVNGLTGIVSIGAGTYHSLAIKSDGTVWSWGQNNYGQLGDGTNINRTTPVQVSGLSGIREITGGDGYSLAIKNDGTVWTWGLNTYGQLGDGTTTSRSIPVQVNGIYNTGAVAGGYGHSLAVTNQQVRNITPYEANILVQGNLTNPNFVILDVRTAAEYATGFIANSINIDYYSANFQSQLATLDTTKTYLVNSGSGVRSAATTNIMASMGFTMVYNMLGGTTGWLRAGYPIQTNGLLITTTSLPAGQVGMSYGVTLTASGGNPPYTWSIQSGTLPAGLSLISSTGAITGTPTAATTATITFKVTDSLAKTATKDLAITINNAGTLTLYENYYATADSTGIGLHAAQTFTPQTAYTIKSAKLRLWNTGATGNVSVSIRAVDTNGVPVGGNLVTSAGVANSSIPPAWTVVEFDLGAGYLVQTGTKYALQIDSETAGLYATVDTAGTYTRGSYLSASNDQSYWNNHSGNWDIWFEEWGTGGGATTYTLTVNISGQGSVIKNPDKTAYNPGDVVQLTATASSGWAFSAWSGDLSGSTSPASITMNSNKTVTATFTQTSSLTLYENYYATADSTGIGLHAAQTFTPQTTHTIKSAKLRLWNTGATGNTWVSIRAVDANGIPAGSDLVTSTPILNSSIPAAWTTVEFNLGTGYPLQAGTKYALQINSDASGLYAPVDISGTYAFGAFLSANDSQTYWNDHNNTWDTWFEEWGTGSGKTPTILTLVSSPNPSTSGQTVTFTATVSGSGGTPSGDVDFKDGNSTIGSSTLSAGSAVFSTGYLFVGIHSITAIYYGDSNFDSSISSPITQTVNSGGVTNTLYENYHAKADTTGIGLHVAQTFTPQTTHTINSAKLRLWNTGATGNTWVSIRAVDANGTPAGPDLVTSTPILNSSIPAAWTTVEFNLGTGYPLQAGTKYAFQINSDASGLYAPVDISGTYAFGAFLSANDSQTYWNDHNNTWDTWFEEWGTP